MKQQKWTILGQDPDVLLALFSNVVSWFVSAYFPSFMPRLLPPCEQEDASSASPASDERTKCVSIGRPGGLEQLRVIRLKQGICTKGYNVGDEGGPFMEEQELPADCAIVKLDAFSVNYADCAIRWGLYESAKQYVGWPIVPGFELAGTVERVGEECSSGLQKGDRVVGCTLFGAYSSRAIVPEIQLRKIPKGLGMSQAASLPAESS